MGPVELADVVGLDVCKHVGDIVSKALNKQTPDTSRIDALIAAKKLGRKTGEGFYVWRDGKAVKSTGPVAEPPADLQDRLILALANECAAALREGIVADADLVDAGVHLRLGIRAVSRRPADLRAQTRRRCRGRATRGTHAKRMDLASRPTRDGLRLRTAP